MIRLEETLLENLSVGGRISNFSKIKAFLTKNRTFLTKNNTQNSVFFATGNDNDFWIKLSSMLTHYRSIPILEP